MPSLPFLLPLPVETKDKETDMKCPECNNEVNEKEQQCPHCGAPLHHEDRDEEPTLGRGMVAFIIIGTVFLVAFGFFYYSQHKNDPEYTQTAIEPDSNLADNDKAKFDTIARKRFSTVFAAATVRTTRYAVTSRPQLLPTTRPGLPKGHPARPATHRLLRQQLPNHALRQLRQNKGKQNSQEKCT